MKISTTPIVDADGRPTGEGELTTIELTTDDLGRAIRSWVEDQLPTADYARLSEDGGLFPLRYAEIHIGGQSLDMVNGARVVVKRGGS